MSDDNRFTLEKVDIPFVDVVKLLIKWSLAAIPAIIILSIIFSLTFGIANFLFGFFSTSSFAFFAELGFLGKLLIILVIVITLAVIAQAKFND